MPSDASQSGRSRATPRLEIRRFQKTLKQMMLGRGYHYEDLARALGVSLSTAKRLLSSDDLSFERVLDVCAWLNIDFYKLAALTQEKQIEWDYLSLAQEKFLAANPRLFRMLRLLQRGRTPHDIMQSYDLPEVKALAYVEALAENGFVSLTADGLAGPVVPLVPARTDWLVHGPLWRTYLKQQVARFVDKFFDPERAETNRHIEYGLRRLSPGTYRRFQKEVEDLYKKYAALSELELETTPDARMVPMTCLILIDQFWDDMFEDIEL